MSIMMVNNMSIESNVLNKHGQYTDEFIEFLDSMRPHHDALIKGMRDYLKDNDCTCIDYRLIHEYVVQELVMSGLSLWMECYEKDRITNQEYQGWDALSNQEEL